MEYFSIGYGQMEFFGSAPLKLPTARLSRWMPGGEPGSDIVVLHKEGFA
jgi:hypothetical protein